MTETKAVSVKIPGMLLREIPAAAMAVVHLLFGFSKKKLPAPSRPVAAKNRARQRDGGTLAQGQK